MITLMVAHAWFSSTTPPAGMTIPLVMLPDWYLHTGVCHEACPEDAPTKAQYGKLCAHGGMPPSCNSADSKGSLHVCTQILPCRYPPCLPLTCWISFSMPCTADADVDAALHPQCVKEL